MYTCILWYTAVMCLAFSSIAQMTIVDEMRDELSSCPFPAAEDLKQSNQSRIFSFCLIPKPTLIDGKPIRDELKFSFGKYLCMELFDLSLQLCRKNISEDTLEVFQEKFSLSQNMTTFCERLKFPTTYATQTMQSAVIAVDTLKNRTLCESHCIVQNTLHPVCGAISWASTLLISLSPQQIAEDKSDSKDVVVAVQSNQEHVPSELKSEASNQSTTKEEIVTKTSNSAVTENKTTPSKIIDTGKIASNTPVSKEVGPNADGSSLGKHILDGTSTQMATATSTVSSGIAEVPNREVPNREVPNREVPNREVPNREVPNREVEKDNDREEDNGVYSPRGSDSGVSENNKYHSDDEGENEALKGSEDVPAQEGYADEEAQSRGNSADGLPIDSRVYHDAFDDTQDSHFFAYFLTMVVICIIGYLVFHNKQKIIALALEGRRMQGSRRRPSTSSYKKLDSNLEEAVTSTCSSSSVTHIIF